MENEDTTSTKEELVAKFLQLSKTLESLNQQENEAKKKSERTELEKERLKDEIKALKTENEKLKELKEAKRISFLQKEKQREEDELITLRKILEEKCSETEEMKAKHEMKINSLAKPTQDFSDYYKLVDKKRMLQKESLKLKEEVEQKQLLSVEKKEKLESLKMSSCELKSKIEQTQTSMSELRLKLKEFNLFLKEEDEKIALFSSELAVLKAAQPAPSSLFSELDCKREEVVDQYNKMKACYRGKMSEIRNLEKEITKLKSDLDGLSFNKRLSEFWREKCQGLEKAFQAREADLKLLIYILEHRPETPKTITISSDDLSKLNRVPGWVEDIKKEAIEITERAQQRSMQALNESFNLSIVEAEIRAQNQKINEQIKMIEESKNKCVRDTDVENGNETGFETTIMKKNKTVRFAENVEEENSTTDND